MACSRTVDAFVSNHATLVQVDIAVTLHLDCRSRFNLSGVRAHTVSRGPRKLVFFDADAAVSSREGCCTVLALLS